MGKSNRKILVYRDMPTITTNEQMDIILTPQFYSFLKEELGVKFAYQAKQIAPSFFDDYLDATKEYHFFVYKCKEYWCFFAYNVEEIISFLEDKGLNKHQINKIFFAQELAQYMERAINLGNNIALQSIDGITTILPKRLLDSEYNYQELDLDTVSLNNGISISSSYSSLVPLKQTITMTILLVILGGIFIIDATQTRNSIQSDIEKLEVLLDNNPKLSSNRIRKSILEQYKPIDKKERLKRDTIDNISKLLSSQSRLKELTLDNKKIIAIIETTSDKISNQVVTNAHSKKLTVKKQSAKQIKVEGVL
jgi:hypothetical protein